MKHKHNNSGFGIIEIIVLLLALVLIGSGAYYVINRNDDKKQSSQPAVEEYNPSINPEDFTTKITNPYFSLPVGRKLVYEVNTKEGLERSVITITGATKKITGVETLIYHDVVSVNGIVAEATRDYVAQDKDGNVWYFGEDVENYEGGQFTDHEGSWLAGVNGAKPGYWIKADNKVGDSYKQEYDKGEAEDTRNVVAVNETVKTKLATYTGCIKFYDWTPIDKKTKENKWHCPGVAAEVATTDLETGDFEELVSIIKK